MYSSFYRIFAQSSSLGGNCSYWIWHGCYFCGHFHSREKVQFPFTLCKIMFLSVHNSMPSTDLLGVFLMLYGSTLLFTDVVRSTPCSSTILNPTSPCERKATRSAPLCKSTSHLLSKSVFFLVFTISPFESICYIQMLWRACKNCTVRINSVCLYTMYSVYTKKEGALDRTNGKQETVCT